MKDLLSGDDREGKTAMPRQAWPCVLSNLWISSFHHLGQSVSVKQSEKHFGHFSWRIKWLRSKVIRSISAMS